MLFNITLQGYTHVLSSSYLDCGYNVIDVIIYFVPSQTIWQFSSVGKGVRPTSSKYQDLSPVWPEPCVYTQGDNIHPIQPIHVEDDRLHNSDVAMQQAKIARCQV